MYPQDFYTGRIVVLELSSISILTQLPYDSRKKYQKESRNAAFIKNYALSVKYKTW